MKKTVKFLIPSFITFFMMSLIFFLNDLYPFGTKPLLQVDADYLYVPTLYKMYDLIHHGGSLFYNDLGLGNSIYGSLIIQGSLFSPFNLLLYFINRNNIIDFFGLFIIIKLCFISFTTYIYINNKYSKIEYFYKVLFSILYTFNGFIILNYYNDIWLEFVILFPLLVMYLDKLLKNEGELGYIIVLALSIIISIYYSSFILIFIIFYSSVNLIFNKNNNKKEIIFKLGKSTFIALLISSFSSLPLLNQIFNSSRFTSYADFTMFTSITMKTYHILFSPLFVILFIKLINKYKKDKTNILKYIILMLLYIIPIIIDPINALMHGGSYLDLPYRYGFIPLFILLDSSLYYISKFYNEKESKINYFDIGIIIIIILLGVLDIILNNQYRNEIIYKRILISIDGDNLLHITFMTTIIFLMYFAYNFVKNKSANRIMLFLISIYSIILFTSWTIYHESRHFFCSNAQKIYENMNIKSDGRYKMDYTLYTPYYGYILDVSTLDNWIHLIPKEQIEAYSSLGYATNKTKIYSYGGTIFTDWLLNFRYNFSLDEKKDSLFELIDGYDEKYMTMFNCDGMPMCNYEKIYINDYKYLYKYNYNQNYGIVFKNIDANLIYNDNMSKFEYQNSIYHNLLDTNDDIIEYKNYSSNNKNKINIRYEINDDGYLYIYDHNDSVKYIDINRNIINNDKGNAEHFVDNILYLGNYSKDVNLTIYLNEDDETNFDIGFIKKEKILELSSDVSYKDDKYYINSNKGNYLFLPINNIDGIKVYNNGKKIETLRYLNNFICVKLDDGQNIISIKYELPLLNIGIYLSLLGIILLILNKKIIGTKILLTTTYFIYKIIVIVVFIYYYFYSIIKYVIT